VAERQEKKKRHRYRNGSRVFFVGIDSADDEKGPRLQKVRGGGGKKKGGKGASRKHVRAKKHGDYSSEKTTYRRYSLPEEIRGGKGCP